MVHGSWLKAQSSWLMAKGASMAPGLRDARGLAQGLGLMTKRGQPSPGLGARWAQARTWGRASGPRGRAGPLGHEP